MSRTMWLDAARLLAPLAEELVRIRWLLIALLVVFALLLAVLVAHFILIVRINSARFAQMVAAKKDAEIDELLAADKAIDAKIMASEWLSNNPMLPEAHWAMARTYHRLGQFADAKRVLKKLTRLAPEQRMKVNYWLEEIELDLKEAKPRSID